MSGHSKVDHQAEEGERRQQARRPFTKIAKEIQLAAQGWRRRP